MTAPNAKYSPYGKFMPYRPPAQKSYQRPLPKPAASFPVQARNPAKPFFSGMAPASRFVAAANPKKRLAGLEKTGATPAKKPQAEQAPKLQNKSVPAPSPTPAASSGITPSIKPGELGREQGRIQGLSRSANPKHRELAKARYDKLVPSLQGLGTHRADHPGNAALTRKLLGGDDKRLGVQRLQAAVVVLGKGHYLGNFGNAGIDGKRGYFTEQAVSKVKAELGLKSDAEIISAARKKLAAATAPTVRGTPEQKPAAAAQKKESPSIPAKPKQVQAAQDYSDAIQSMRRATTRETFVKAQDRGVAVFKSTALNNQALFQLVSQTFGKMSPQPLMGESIRKGA